ncbi:hypothetical protein [Aquisphaera insulae]|uniref:hypothetical protein n=1 Tax=Aquisphaera insulae TaxID=2712864 RepID=UPI0013EE0DA7|nr:hypothetical protein [Aquisphaera insulae]
MGKTSRIGNLIVLGVVAVVLGVPLLVILNVFYGVHAYPGVFARNIEKGRPLVQAVYAYRSDVGLYPERLEDLVPDYLAAVPEGWQYRAPAEGVPARLQLHGAFHSFLSYYFARPVDSRWPADFWPEGWEYNQEGTLHFQGRDVVPVPPLRTSTEGRK